ncbi:MAG: hypothetical protein RIA64_01405 [Rhodospirillales bacterium]
MSQEIYARKGERITCTEGHHICTMAKDAVLGDMPEPEDYTDWQIPEPKFGAYPTCHCGAPFFSTNTGTVLHFEDGWRNPRGLEIEWKPPGRKAA